VFASAIHTGIQGRIVSHATFVVGRAAHIKLDILKSFEWQEVGPAEGGPRARAMIAKVRSVREGLIAARPACHRLLDHLLMNTLDAGDHYWELRHANSGAPRLLVNGEASDLNVSLSHSGQWVAVSVARQLQVGLDIEEAEKRRNTTELAEFLGWRDWGSNPVDFYYRWTLWEACVKCVEGSVLMSHNPGFNQLSTRTQPGQMVTAGRWSALQDRASGEAFFSIVHQSPTGTSLQVQELEWSQLKVW
jgi:phosphopantetheinyl transferase